MHASETPMDLSNLTLDELQQRLKEVDKDKSPHESLELSNEIGRRTAEQDGPYDAESLRQAGFNAVRRSPWWALGGILIFSIASHIDPPDDRIVLCVVVAGVVSALATIRMWSKAKGDLFFASGILLTTITSFFGVALSSLIQYGALFTGVSATVIFIFRSQILEQLEKGASVLDANTSIEPTGFRDISVKRILYTFVFVLIATGVYVLIEIL